MIFFKSEAHRERFLTAMQKQLKVYENGTLDQEYGAAFYILCADAGTWEHTNRYIDEWGIGFKALLEVPYSSGEAVLLKLAGNLFGAECHVDPIEFMSLDECNFQIALSAIQIRRVSLRLNDIEGGR